MGPGQYRDRGHLVRVVAVPVPVGPQQIRQHQRISCIGLCARDGIPVPISVDRLRVDRKHPVTRPSQRRDQQPAVGLQPDIGHRRRLGMRTQQLTQRGEPGNVVGDPPLRQHRTIRVDDRDVVMMLGPVDPAIHHHPNPSSQLEPFAEP